VERVNNPETGLEDMIALAAEGLTLIRSSEQLLAEAELKIQRLEQNTPAPADEKQSNDDAEFSLI
jgi:exodeoxyribonuclease VII small subunit